MSVDGFRSYLLAAIGLLLATMITMFTATGAAFLPRTQYRSSAFVTLSYTQSSNNKRPLAKTTSLQMTSDLSVTTFREAEVLGLKLMQEGNYQDALKVFKKGLQLPGSKQDVIRTKMLSGPSPVGGSAGGTESRNVESLDEFELQAAHYNMACAYAQLGELSESISALQTAFENGFDNYATVRGDPDLEPIKNEKDFERLMDAYEPKKGGGFNPFGLFKKK